MAKTSEIQIPLEKGYFQVHLVPRATQRLFLSYDSEIEYASDEDGCPIENSEGEDQGCQVTAILPASKKLLKYFQLEVPIPVTEPAQAWVTAVLYDFQLEEARDSEYFEVFSVNIGKTGITGRPLKKYGNVGVSFDNDICWGENTPPKNLRTAVNLFWDAPFEHNSSLDTQDYTKLYDGERRNKERDAANIKRIKEGWGHRTEGRAKNLLSTLRNEPFVSLEGPMDGFIFLAGTKADLFQAEHKLSGNYLRSVEDSFDDHRDDDEVDDKKVMRLVMGSAIKTNAGWKITIPSRNPKQKPRIINVKS